MPTLMERFEADYVGQGRVNRGMQETLRLGWKLLQGIPRGELTRVRQDYLDRYHTSR
jgi:V/A-type H+-transporting ATPase subunit B